MRKTAMLVLLLAVPALGAAGGGWESAYMEPPGRGIGIQKLAAGWGLSGMADINDRLSLQAVIGPFGSLHVYSGRVLYRLYGKTDWGIYGFGQAARYLHEHGPEGSKESAFSLGGGLGAEYDWRRNYPGMIPLVWSVELAFLSGELEGRGISGLGIGAGVHFRF